MDDCGPCKDIPDGAKVTCGAFCVAPMNAIIALPGMPVGSPGMGDDPDKSFMVSAVTKDGVKPTVFASERRSVSVRFNAERTISP